MNSGQLPRDLRVHVNLPARLITVDGEIFRAVVLDLSHAGFRARCSEELFESERIEIELGRSGFAAAEVLWSRGGEIGARFLDHEAASAQQALASGCL